MREGDDPRDIYWRKSTAAGPARPARARARDAAATSSSSLDVVRHAGRRPTTTGRRASSGASATSRRAPSRTSSAATPSSCATTGGERVRGDRTVGADPLLRFLALVEPVDEPPPQCEPIARRRRAYERTGRAPTATRRRRTRGRARRASSPSARAGVRFGLVHRIMTDALAALGVLALVVERRSSTAGSSGDRARRPRARRCCVPRALAAITRAAAPRDDRAARRCSRVQVARVVLGREPARRRRRVRRRRCRSSASRRGAARRTTSRSSCSRCCTSIAGTVLGGGLAYGLCFVGFLIVAPGALVLSHLRREVEGNYRQGARDRTGPAGRRAAHPAQPARHRPHVPGRHLPALDPDLPVHGGAVRDVPARRAVAAAARHRGSGERMVGFSDSRRPRRGRACCASDPRSRCGSTSPDLPEPPPRALTLHLRGTAFDRYDGRTWSQSRRARARRTAPADADGPRSSATARCRRRPQRCTIDLEPIDPPGRLPAARRDRRSGCARSGAARTRSSPSPLTRGPEGELRYQHADDRGLRYDVFRRARRAPTFQRSRRPRTARATSQLPADLPRARRRARRTSGPHGAADGLREGAGDRGAPAHELPLRPRLTRRRQEPQPLDDFLFDSKRGHCEFYSTAMAVMLRTLGVPTRNVTGFIGGTYNRFGRYYAVRQGDAHSWVEVYVDGQGWVTFDPTPPADARAAERHSPALGRSCATWSRRQPALGPQRRRLRPRPAGRPVPRADRQVGKHRGRSTESAPPAGVALIIGVGGVVRDFRAPSEPAAQEQGPAPETPSRDVLRATSIYENLEAALGAQGVHRSPGTPPLRHAENLLAASHPLAHEVHEITQVYLSVRFGGMHLSDEVGSSSNATCGRFVHASGGRRRESAVVEARVGLLSTARVIVAEGRCRRGRGWRRPGPAAALPAADSRPPAETRSAARAVAPVGRRRRRRRGSADGRAVRRRRARGRVCACLRVHARRLGADTRLLRGSRRRSSAARRCRRAVRSDGDAAAERGLVEARAPAAARRG